MKKVIYSRINKTLFAIISAEFYLLQLRELLFETKTECTVESDAKVDYIELLKSIMDL